ncbi:MAG: cell division topological specificity factor MinE [Anaerolineae bacterium]
MSFFSRFFRPKENSSSVAKNRRQLVLVHDRVNLSPGKMDELKDELIQVISKYVDIDRDGIDITLTENNNQSRLTAQIPLLTPPRQRNSSI